MLTIGIILWLVVGYFVVGFASYLADATPYLIFGILGCIVWPVIVFAILSYIIINIAIWLTEEFNPWDWFKRND